MQRRIFSYLIFGLLLICSRPAFAQDVSLEYKVKAAYLCNFLKFIEWQKTPQQELRICLVGNNPFGDALQQIAEQSDSLLPIRISQIKTEQDLLSENIDSCHLIYLPRGSEQLQKTVKRRIDLAPILTVSENPEPAMLQFMILDGKVRFKADRELLSASNLKLSSKLLKLALTQ